jgi:iron complex outermembrane receptor protein
MTSFPLACIRRKSSAQQRRAPAVLIATLATLALVSNAVAQTSPSTTTSTSTSSSSGSTAGSATTAPVLMAPVAVNSVRGSLISSQEIKENSLQFVDSIVAQDIGKFPDNTVADALQHVPGVQVGRDNGEVNSVVIRGLPNLGTTLNGEEIFTGTGRGVALQDIPAELVAGVDVYKTSSPEQIEGGIAGLIDIRLRKPFDFDGFAAGASGRALFSKYADDTSWIGSAMVSDRFKLKDGGEIGALLSISGSRRHFFDQRVFNFLFEPTDVPAGIPGAGTNTKLQLPVTAGSLITPGDRKRTGIDFALQWRPNKDVEVYGSVLYTAYRNKHDVNFFIGFPRFGTYQNVTLVPGTNVVDSETTTNNFHLNSTQAFNDKTDGYQLVGGVKWTHDKLTASTDIIYNWNSAKNRVMIIDTQYVAPSTFTFDLNNDSGTNVGITGGNYRDAANYRLWGMFDNHGYQTSDQTAWRADGAYNLGASAIPTLKFGVRLSSRDVRSRQTSQNDIPPAAGRGVTPTASIPGFGSLAPDGIFSSSQFAASNWYAGDANFLRDNAAVLRPLFGQPVTDPNFNPTLAVTDKEKTYAGYVSANYKIATPNNPIEGLFGVRFVKTDQELVSNLITGAPVTGSKDQWDILPVVNGKIRLPEDIVFRFSAGRTITRPNFADLNPVVTLNGPTTTGGTTGTGTGGNPDLNSVKSNNFDIAFEYYFAKDSYTALTGFYRQTDGYVQSITTTEHIGTIDYNVTRPRNSEKGHLQGIEATYQQFFDFVPPWLKGLGLQMNFTYITGKNRAQDPNSQAAVPPIIDLDYAQVSKDSYNIIGIFERGPFSARLAYNWRGKYVDTFNGPNAPASGLRTVSVKATDWMDFSASYNFGKNFTVTLDATNLLNQKYKDYFGTDASTYPRDSRRFDRTIEIGARWRY